MHQTLAFSYAFPSILAAYRVVAWRPAERPFSDEWYFADALLTLLKPHQRTRYSPGIGHAFRRQVELTLPAPLKPPLTVFSKKLEVHHIVPLCVGGCNNHMALVPPVWHRLVHDVMRPDILKLQYNREGIVTIPLRLESVWANRCADVFVLDNAPTPLFPPCPPQMITPAALPLPPKASLFDMKRASVKHNYAFADSRA